jgi:acetyl esterase/lipase
VVQVDRFDCHDLAKSIALEQCRVQATAAWPGLSTRPNGRVDRPGIGRYVLQICMNSSTKKSLSIEHWPALMNAGDASAAIRPSGSRRASRPPSLRMLRFGAVFANQGVGSILVAILLACLPAGAGQNAKSIFLLADSELIKQAEPIVYKKTPQEDLRLYLLRPAGRSSRPLPAIVYFTGGGWVNGTAEGMIANAAWFRDQGIIGIAADYRVKNRHGTTPLECVKDGKSAIRYVRLHARELGVDPDHIIAAGGSAGGHVAAATALPGNDEADENLDVSSKPNALVLHNPALGAGFGEEFFSTHSDCSPLAGVSAGWPPTILSCGTKDLTTPFPVAERFTKAMQAAGNVCELVSVKEAEHSCDWPVTNANFLPTAKRMADFLRECGIIPIAGAADLETLRHSFKPGEIWPDTAGEPINCHGGGILFHEGVYYWFGEYKIAGTAGNVAHEGVSCYSSSDLYNWKNEGIALPVVKNDPKHDIAEGCILERPKVIFNAKTGKFVMWFHLELKGQEYSAARSGVAIADHVTGPYRFVDSFRPDGSMARDMTLFVDDDGKAYQFYASENNETLHISLLTDDFLKPSGKMSRVFQGRFMEAPAVCKSNGKYWLIASGCSGWAPNAARSAVADSIFGPWTELGNPCSGPKADTTFDGQSTFILPVQGKSGAFIFMGDRWRPENAIDGRHLWLPLQFENGKIAVHWRDQWDLKWYDTPSIK